TLGLPTRDEMDALNKKLDRINRKVNKLAREQKAK
ncbi:MAG TPA: poly(hydroxyalkanoate) granule-associated protein, partial [Alcanivorax sp.]|nr:poly(hydroxyalkanoate) granule-associated protein [Alcanivorax sp.]